MDIELLQNRAQLGSIALTTLFLALFGGVQFYLTPWVLWVFLIVGFCSLPVSAWLLLKREFPPGLLPGLLLVAAMTASTAANLDIWPVTAGRLILAVIALSVLILAHQVGPEMLSEGLYYAGLVWPLVYVVSRCCLGWWSNPNILADWSLIFFVIGFTRPVKFYSVAHLGMVIFIGSRGAGLGVIAALLVLGPYLYTGRFVNSTSPVFSWAAGILGSLVILSNFASKTALYRFQYWLLALTAPDPGHVVFGIGPAGLKAGRFIDQPGGGFQVHAHNVLISHAAELGLVGLAALALGVVYTWRNWQRWRIYQWQVAIIAGLLVHSLVDQPLWWPGLMVAFTAVVGSVSKR